MAEFRLSHLPEGLARELRKQEETRRQLARALAGPARPLAEIAAEAAKFRQQYEEVLERAARAPTAVRSYGTAEWRTARHVEALADVASEQHELLAQVRDELVKSEERRAAAEKAAAEAEAMRHSQTVRATWRSAIVAAVVSVVLTVVVTFALRLT